MEAYNIRPDFRTWFDILSKDPKSFNNSSATHSPVICANFVSEESEANKNLFLTYFEALLSEINLKGLPLSMALL